MWRFVARRAFTLPSLCNAFLPPPHTSLLPVSSSLLRPISRAVQAVPCPLSDDSDRDPDSHLNLRPQPPPGRFHNQHPQPQGQKAERNGSTYAELKRRQIRTETEEWERAAREYRELLADMCQRGLAPNLPYAKSLFAGWFEPLRDRITEEQEACREGRCRFSYALHFTQLAPEKMAIITMHTLVGLLMTGSAGGCALVVRAAIDVGNAVEQEARIQRFLQKTGKKREENCKGEPMIEQQEDLRKKVTGLIKKQRLFQVRKIVKEYDDSKPWGQEIQAKVGSRLIEMLIDTAYIQPSASQSADSSFDIRPAFHHRQKSMPMKKEKTSLPYGIIECDPLVLQGMERVASHMVIPYMPMLVPPLKWTGFDKGAHFFLPSYLMRTHGSKQRMAVKMASRQEMRMVYETLNILGNTKWRINKKVLDIVDRIWTSGGGLASLVDQENLLFPEKPDTDDESAIKSWRWEARMVKRQNQQRHSLHCDTELKLSVARKMKDEEGFYYPHNIDFRGRAYPMHPHLNHLGSDLCRGILEFAEGRPLGKSGLYWLKIHLANLYGSGVDKLSYEGRIAFAENHVEDILDSADRPLEGRRWWLDAEDPFQCLAVCINLADALRNSSPEATISHLPIHQDGSCNGLQHYAALGRDKLGAAAVNLISGEKPADVYTEIASRVLQIMQSDAAKDPASYPNALHAKFLLDQVDRKFVKQTVMTSVYGVTYIGARQQMKRRLKERGINDDVELFRACCYAAGVTLTALGEMFQAARGIMNWLGDCAKVIASENYPVSWVTPVGLPVVQPYYVWGKQEVKTSLQILALRKQTDKVMVKRQRSAFPPNFVHSLDSSHMMMTAIACNKSGLHFAGVHDSFWTHACHVDVMNKILREKFVELYEKPVLENLLEGFQRSFPSLKSEFPPLPDRGDFDLKDVINSTYFFN